LASHWTAVLVGLRTGLKVTSKCKLSYPNPELNKVVSFLSLSLVNIRNDLSYVSDSVKEYEVLI